MSDDCKTGNLPEPHMSPKQFEEALNLAIDYAQTAIGAKPEELTPSLMIHYVQIEGGKLSEIRCDVNALYVDLVSWEEKKQTMTALAQRCYEERKVPVAIFFIAEGLQNQRAVDQPKLQPYDDVTSKEVVMVAGLQIMGSHAVMGVVPLERDEAGLYKRRAENAIHRDASSPLLMLFWRAFAEQAIKGQGH